MWTNSANKDQFLNLAGGFIKITVEYVYNDRPGFRVIASGVKNIVFPNVYGDEIEAKKDAEEYGIKLFEQFREEISHLKATRSAQKNKK